MAKMKPSKKVHVSVLVGVTEEGVTYVELARGRDGAKPTTKAVEAAVNELFWENCKAQNVTRLDLVLDVPQVTLPHARAIGDLPRWERKIVVLTPAITAALNAEFKTPFVGPELYEAAKTTKPAKKPAPKKRKG